MGPLGSEQLESLTPGEKEGDPRAFFQDVHGMVMEAEGFGPGFQLFPQTDSPCQESLVAEVDTVKNADGEDYWFI